MRVLVTGGTGYIGSHTTVELLKVGYEVELLDNLVNSKEETVEKIKKITDKRPRFYEVDLCNFKETEKVFKDTKFDAVIHFAGLKAVGESVEKPLEYYENNIVSTLNLLKLMKETNVPKLIFSSSATVYGDQGPEEKAYNEGMTTGVGITSPYGWTKSMIEQIIRDFAVATPGFSATLLRYFNPIGADRSGELGEDPNGIPNNLMPIVMKVFLGEIPELTVFGDDYPTEDGSCKRDFIHVTDLSLGHIAALEKMHEGVQVYNLGSGKATSVFEIIREFEAVSGEKLPVKIGARRAGDLAEFYADPSKAKRELDWATRLSVKDAIVDTLNYLKKLK